MHGRIIDGIRMRPARKIRPRSPSKVAVEALCHRKARKRRLLQLQGAMQKTPWTRRVDDEPGMQVEWLIACPTNKSCTILPEIEGLDPNMVAVVHSKALRLPHQKVIHVGTIPMGVGDLIMRARRHQ